MAAEPLLGLVYTDLSDTADANIATKEVVESVRGFTVMRFASAAARTAAFSAAAVTPTEGMASYLLDVRRMEVYRNATLGWLPADGLVDALRVRTSGVAFQTISSGSETDIPKMTVTGAKIAGGDVLHLTGQAIYTTTDSSTDFDLIIRMTTALSGPVIGATKIESRATGVGTAVWDVVFPVAADNASASFFFSALRRNGSGSVSLFAQLNQDMTFSTIRRSGDSSRLRDVT